MSNKLGWSSGRWVRDGMLCSKVSRIRFLSRTRHLLIVILIKFTLFVWRFYKLLFHFSLNNNELMNLKVLPLHSSHFLFIWYSNFHNILFSHLLWSFFYCASLLLSNHSFFSYFNLAFKNFNFNSRKRKLKYMRMNSRMRRRKRGGNALKENGSKLSLCSISEIE